MNDFETLCALYDRRGIRYSVESNAEAFGKAFHKAVIVTVDRKRDAVSGYEGFVCYHSFDEHGNLTNVLIGE